MFQILPHGQEVHTHTHARTPTQTHASMQFGDRHFSIQLQLCVFFRRVNVMDCGWGRGAFLDRAATMEPRAPAFKCTACASESKRVQHIGERKRRGFHIHRWEHMEASKFQWRQGFEMEPSLCVCPAGRRVVFLLPSKYNPPHVYRK